MVKTIVNQKYNISKIKKVIGTNTNSAVKSGFYWGYEGLINNILKKIHNKNVKAIFISHPKSISFLKTLNIYFLKFNLVNIFL